MLRLIIQIFLVGLVVYAGYQNRYRLINVALSNGILRRFLVTKSLDMPMFRDKMMQSMFTQTK
ncbi:MULTISPECIES: hypothetical protein [Bacillaceae]|uniref:Uncharacterized protein n=2 Tax=Peribacillus simplex TaxID=1478 RepID=A0A223ELZ6_9BACI|nr:MULTISPECIES: hypothetical protein [Bacillaceae]ASS96221.1 hypothetical protein BS1321_21275 [Peribacillus simplex NBRC 15720 = DSM 1321]MBT2665469.1 hypothetical protein [Bacillus sp. ISL-4]MEC1397334.1 hypothetical protein [Peribacillus simplex]MED3911298.1 hypothetical protein [Peribacillus simplex]MED3985367.1 hypothetical protein [Peribacillus simplex]